MWFLKLRSLISSERLGLGSDQLSGIKQPWHQKRRNWVDAGLNEEAQQKLERESGNLKSILLLRRSFKLRRIRHENASTQLQSDFLHPAPSLSIEQRRFFGGVGMLGASLLHSIFSVQNDRKLIGSVTPSVLCKDDDNSLHIPSKRATQISTNRPLHHRL